MSESIGALIGLSNVLTRTRTRVKPGPSLDGEAALRERVRSRALRALEGREAYIQDALIFGRRVRLFTNSHHLADFWKDNFHTEQEWREQHGAPPSRTPSVCVHAAIGVEEEAEASYADPVRGEAYLINTSYYGDLRACTMESLARVLAPEGRLFHGSAVQVAGRGLAVLYPKEVIVPTPSWGLLELAGSKFIADGWLLLDAKGQMHALEKGVYFRTCTVEHYPDLIPRILGAKFENVPPPDAAGLDQRAEAAQTVLDEIRRRDTSGRLRSLPSERGREMILRWTSGSDGRCLAPAATLFGAGRLLASAPVDAVFALRADKDGPVAVPSPIDHFPCPGYEVRPAVVTGHPRDVSRLIART